MKLTINGNLCTSMGEVKEYASVEVYQFLKEYLDGNSTIIVHTSGSTGTPKKIKLNKSDMRASAKLTNDFFGLTENSIFYLNLSPRYIAGKMMIVRALELGAKIEEEIPSNEPLRHYAKNMQIDLGAFVPSQIIYLLQNPEKLCFFKNIIIGGGKIPQRIERWLAEKGINAYSTYGMTETCSHIALARVSTEAQPYKALGNVTFELDSRNCLKINMPQFETKSIQTNDVVDLSSPTEFYWRGRFDNVINTGGLKVFPEEIEPVIAKHLHHVRFFITSMLSDKWGEELVLAVEYPSLAQGEKRCGSIHKELIDKLKNDLPSFQVPKRYIAVNKFAETSSGKVIRKL